MWARKAKWDGQKDNAPHLLRGSQRDEATARFRCSSFTAGAGRVPFDICQHWPPPLMIHSQPLVHNIRRVLLLLLLSSASPPLTELQAPLWLLCPCKSLARTHRRNARTHNDGHVNGCFLSYGIDSNRAIENGWMVAPANFWQPVQCVPRLSPKISWDRFQLSDDPNEDKLYRK